MGASQVFEEDGRQLARLWFGVLGPPVIWSIRFGVSYTLVPYACWWEIPGLLHGVTLLAIAATGIAGWVGWREWKGVGSGIETDGPIPASRVRFMGGFGILSSALFITVIAAEGLANFIIDPCQSAGVPLA